MCISQVTLVIPSVVLLPGLMTQSPSTAAGAGLMSTPQCSRQTVKRPWFEGMTELMVTLTVCFIYKYECGSILFGFPHCVHTRIYRGWNWRDCTEHQLKTNHMSLKFIYILILFVKYLVWNGSFSLEHWNNRDEDVSGGRGALSCDGRREVGGGSAGRRFPLRTSVAEKAGELPPPPT